MESATLKKTNYNSFDVAKFIFSILVVMIHIVPLGKQTDNNILFYINFFLQECLARIAVPMFFVFSGFFLYKKTPQNMFSLEPTKKYCKHILQLYLIWTIIYSPFRLMDALRNSKGFLYGLLEYLKNIVLVGSYGQLWYLYALLFAVLIVSFLLHKNWSPKKILCTSLVFYVLGLLGDGYYGIISSLTDVPVVGEIISLYFRVFTTTRNGLFFGFFFVALGMVLANREYKLPIKKSLALFFLSFVMLCTESVLLGLFDIAKDHNVVVFTIPCALFCFTFLKELKLKDSKIYIILRKISSLIYCSHLFLLSVVTNILELLGLDLKETPLLFIVTLISTIIFSIVVIKLSDYKIFRWLKKLY